MHDAFLFLVAGPTEAACHARLGSGQGQLC